MPYRGNQIRTISVLLIAITIPSAALAQNSDQDQRTWVGDNGNWSDEDSWSDVFFGPGAGSPDLGDSTWGLIGNGRVVTIDGNHSAGALNVSNGTVAIGPNQSLEVGATALTDGVTQLGGNSTLAITGNGSFKGADFSGSGTVDLSGPDAKFSLTGNLSLGGEFRFGVTEQNSPKLSVQGDAVLSGRVAPLFQGFSPGAGSVFEFLSGADSVDVSQADLVLPEGVALGNGLGALIQATNSSASVVIRNLPVLSINRQTGAATISNVTGDALGLTGYSLFSPNGLLQQSGWKSLASQSVAGWGEANPRDDALAELNLEGAAILEAGATGLSIGNPYIAGNIHPSQEDVEFLVSLTDNSVIHGIVAYTGPPNDFTLRVDPETGMAELSQQSSFLDDFDVTGYSIASPSGALNNEKWTSIKDAVGDDSWIEANPSQNALAEFSPGSTKLFTNGTEQPLGEIFTLGSLRDLTFQYTVAGNESVFVGTVEYGSLGSGLIPGDCNQDGVINQDDLACVTTIEERDLVLAALNTLPGDLDGNGSVAFGDFQVLSVNFGNASKTKYTEGDIDLKNGPQFADFQVLSVNFGKTPAAAASVPEPTSALLTFMSFLAALRIRKRRLATGA